MSGSARTRRERLIKRAERDTGAAENRSSSGREGGWEEGVRQMVTAESKKRKRRRGRRGERGNTPAAIISVGGFSKGGGGAVSLTSSVPAGWEKGPLRFLAPQQGGGPG